MGTLLFIFAAVFSKTNANGPIFESIQPEIIVDNEEITIFVSTFSFLKAFVGQQSWLFVGFSRILNSQAIGMDSGVHFSLSNFLEEILQRTSSKMSPMSNLGL